MNIRLFYFHAAALAVAALPCARAELTAAKFFPANGATDVSPDTPLHLTFSSSATAVSGNIKICDADSKHVLETISLESPVATKTIGGLDNYKYYTVIVTGNEATFFPKPGTLAYHKNYYVTVDAGTFKNGSDSFDGVSASSTWHFSTKASAPAHGTPELTIAADGTGDFCTVQGALDFVPAGNTAATTLFLRTGTYAEIIFFTDKNAITLIGEDRQQTIIAYPNNAVFNGSGGNPFANRADPSSEIPKQGGAVYRRGMMLAHRVQDFTLANLTLRNTTPKGGSQAEALIVNGTLDARTIIRDVDFYSYQDTVQINGQAYISNCHIEGDVDFMWGTGPSFFENCTFRSLRSSAFYTQIRNPPTNHGFVYLHCTFDGLPGVTDNFLSRIEPHRFGSSEVVLLECTLGSAVGSVAWQLQSPPKGTTPGAPMNVHFWEFNNRDPDGKPIDASQRLAISRQLKLPDDAATINNYKNPGFVLGHDWNPRSQMTSAKPTSR